MRICVDIDGVICKLRTGHQEYSDLAPIPGAVEKLRQLSSYGHYIILYTARRMKTHRGNNGKVVADIGRITLEWLHTHNVPYDEIYFGKPWADIYIDDNAYRFTEWQSIMADGSNFPQSAERRIRS